MKNLIALALSFVLSFLLGFGSEFLAKNLYYHAEAISNGKPMPPTSQWVFEHLARWENGSILFIFMLPWAALLLHCVSAPREISPTERSVRSLNGFMYFALSEGLLFVFFTLSSILPVVDHYNPGPDATPPSAYIPHVLLLALLVSAIIVAVRRFLWRRRDEREEGNGSGKTTHE